MTDQDSAILDHTPIVDEGAAPESWLYVLHGIYGSGRNWGSVTRRLVEERPEWGVILVDLRLHGGSTELPPPHTVRASAADVARLEVSLGRPATAILGHSFGGKVALLRSADPEEGLRQVWVADSTLPPREPSGTAWDIIGIVRGLPDSFASRDELADALTEHGYARGVGQWLAMNLEREGAEFRWKLDWDGVEEMLRDYFATDVWSTVESPPDDIEVHIVKASKSNAIDDESAARVQAAGERTGRVFLHTVEGGHWLNVDNPEAILRLLVERL
ncbi:MAG: alpha/beta hydrolase [Gemmatimonadota bacterium]